MGIPRAAVFPDLARHQGALQANRAGGGLGRDPAVFHDGRLQPVLWSPGESAIGQHPLPCLRLLRTRSLELLRRRAGPGGQQPGHQREPADQSLLSPAGHPHVGSVGRVDRLRHCLRRAHRDDAVLRHHPHVGYRDAAVFPVSGVGHCPGRRAVAFRAERAISGRAVHDPVHHSVLDVRLAGGLFRQPGPGAVALGLRTEPDGRRDRWLPLGFAGPGDRAGADAYRVGGDGRVDLCRRVILFPPDGERLRGRGVAAHVAVLRPAPRRAVKLRGQRIFTRRLMDRMITLERITFDQNMLGGKACIRGMRIPVSLIVNLVANGMSRAEIIAEYPDLDEADIEQDLRYAAWIAAETIYERV